MSAGAWRYALASVAGTGHLERGEPCQDASECEVLAAQGGEAVLVAVTADGAGSARRGGDGAALACALWRDEMAALFAGGGAVADLTAEFAAAWLTRFRHEVGLRADAEAALPRDFACTLLAAVVGEAGAAFVQLGDGAIVVAEADDADAYCWVFWPKRGEYENVTWFATDPAAAAQLDHAFVSRRVDEVALFTDGLQRVALHYASRTAHAPFFRPMFAPVRAATPGRAEGLSGALAAFLASDAVNERTDDDKTLVLATRRGAGEPMADRPPSRPERPACPDEQPGEDEPGEQEEVLVRRRDGG
ncbi:MAG TPA: PP2C family serine/threonine-protein phosphatase [Thermomicrobiales bacterium]|nr:PP2C family serine/threonine-protein phosphatase [Thermomicrobiales bacterium]